MQSFSWTAEHSAALREYVVRGMSYAEAADALKVELKQLEPDLGELPVDVLDVGFGDQPGFTGFELPVVVREHGDGLVRGTVGAHQVERCSQSTFAHRPNLWRGTDNSPGRPKVHVVAATIGHRRPA